MRLFARCSLFLLVACDFLLVAHHSLLVARYFLLVACYFLFVARDFLLVTFCSLLVTLCSLLVAFCSLLVTLCSLLVTFYSLLSTFYSLLAGNSEAFLSSKSKKKSSPDLFVNKKFNLWITRHRASPLSKISESAPDSEHLYKIFYFVWLSLEVIKLLSEINVLSETKVK